MDRERSDQLSRCRNAARDTAESMVRFEKSFDRMQREAKKAMDAGIPDHELTRAMNEGLHGHPDLQRKMTQLLEAMTRRRAVA